MTNKLVDIHFDYLTPLEHCEAIGPLLEKTVTDSSLASPDTSSPSGLYAVERLKRERREQQEQINASLTDATGQHFGATANGKLVGVAGFRANEPASRLQLAGQLRRAELVNVHVDPEYRRRGIGRALFRLAEGGARSQGYAELVAHSGTWARWSGRHGDEFMDVMFGEPDCDEATWVRTWRLVLDQSLIPEQPRRFSLSVVRSTEVTKQSDTNDV